MDLSTSVVAPRACLDVTSGSPIASFLLERVGSASAFVRGLERVTKRQDAYILHLGDTWRVTPKLTLSLGVRWDMHRPSWSATNQNSFFDPHKPNPAAGGRLGAMAFAGTEWGDASFGKRYPEDVFKKAFSPRVGIAYTVNPTTVVRAGYGIYYSQAYYGGWGGGIDDGRILGVAVLFEHTGWAGTGHDPERGVPPGLRASAVYRCGRPERSRGSVPRL